VKILAFVLIILLNLDARVIANEMIGFPVITDGDTIKISNSRIRLHGIDAPEKKQKCKRNTKKYNCGTVATRALIKKIKKNMVKCMVQKSQDRYKRFIGVCFIGKENLNRWMVRNGYAVAYRRYSKDYILDEEFAKKNKIGLWSGSFLKPEKWRNLN
jgi:endonuclease YncB( thermonuclease family)